MLSLSNCCECSFINDETKKVFDAQVPRQMKHDMCLSAVQIMMMNSVISEVRENQWQKLSARRKGRQPPRPPVNYFVDNKSCSKQFSPNHLETAKVKSIPATSFILQEIRLSELSSSTIFEDQCQNKPKVRGFTVFQLSITKGLLKSDLSILKK